MGKAQVAKSGLKSKKMPGKHDESSVNPVLWHHGLR
jgi:hypothetical protein